MKKIVIVIADGGVESIFSNEEIEVEIVDFDNTCDLAVQEELGDYVDECRKTMKEIVC